MPEQWPRPAAMRRFSCGIPVPRMGEIQLWDTADPVHPAAKGHSFSGQASSVESLLFSPDGQTLATGGEDGVIRLWALDAGRTTRRVCAVTAHTLTKSEWRRYVGNLPYHPPCP
ncbi:WD40 repeat domain-containing protein [Streptomyces sp. NBC_01719]|uniref:WD40 repeat domain-containing protein n=2 Tax=Streptomyces TaxID=1883 RepID=UPI00338F14D0